MTLTADSRGVITGKFTIPANVLAGKKRVHFEGAGGSFADADFFGQGYVETLTKQLVTTVTTVLTPVPRPPRVDPLAQTFSLPAQKQIGAVDLFVTAKGTTPIVVQIRETEVGYPTGTVLAEAQLAPADITINAWNRFTLSWPLPLMADVEYAVVVMCNDAVGAVAIAELGKFDNDAQKWVTNQPYQVGVLLSSSNASTWTAHQDKDLAFRLQAVQYTEASHEYDLGHVTVTGATDLLVLATTDQPAAGATSEVTLTLPDTTVLKSGDGQVFSLGSAVTGDIGVKVKLNANDARDAAAVLAPGMQVVGGVVATSATYVTRSFKGDAGGCNLRVIVDAIVPSGAGFTVSYSADDGATWSSMSASGTPSAIGDGKYEFQFYNTGLTAATLRVKITLTGTITARPFLYNLRASVT